MPVALRNQLTNPVMVQPNAKDQRPLIWAPAGDPARDDVRMVPDDLAEDTAIVKAIKLGRIAVIKDEDEIDRIYDAQAAASMGLAEQQAQANAAHVDVRSTEGVMIGLPCLAGGTRPGQRCPNQAIVPQVAQKTTPPLCTEHTHLSGQYIYVSGADGQPGGWVQLAPQKQ